MGCASSAPEPNAHSAQGRTATAGEQATGSDRTSEVAEGKGQPLVAASEPTSAAGLSGMSMTAARGAALPASAAFAETMGAETGGGKDATSTEVCARVPAHLATGGTILLSPLDLSSGGRAVPMSVFYRKKLDGAALLAALERTLAEYQVLSGRYQAQESSPPTVVELSNAGVPVLTCTSDLTLAEAISHLPTDAGATSPCIFARGAHEAFVPDKAGMDPDVGDATAPLLRVKITTLAAGGTAIGILFQHRVLDADAGIAFMRNWARVFSALDLDPPPLHDRCIINCLDTGNLSPDAVTESENVRLEALEPGAAPMPAFAPVMPKISGGEVCVVPFPKATVEALKAAAGKELPEGSWVSSDDVVLAHVWKAMCEMRCSQLGLPRNSEEMSTCARYTHTPTHQHTHTHTRARARAHTHTHTPGCCATARKCRLAPGTPTNTLTYFC